MTFGTRGKVTTDFEYNNHTNVFDDTARAMAIQPDGRIVLAGYSYTDFALARYNSDGTLDTSFDVDGKLKTKVSGLGAEARRLAFQADGKIVVAGYTSILNHLVVLARYNSDGSLDTTFDGDGTLTTNFVGDGTGMAVQGDDKIIVAGDNTLARYNSVGSLDTSFDGDGQVTINFGFAQSMAIQADGKIVVSGYSSNGSNNDFALARYNSDGSLDTSFSGDGEVMTDFGSQGSQFDEAYSLAQQADGKILLAGKSWDNSDQRNAEFALARYNSDGRLDASFSGDGIVTTKFDRVVAEAQSLGLQSDGRIVVAGSSFDSKRSSFALARYNPDGSLDTSFSGDGKLTIHIGTSDDQAFSMAIQTDGEIVVAGSSRYKGGNRNFAVARYHAGVRAGIEGGDLVLLGTGVADNIQVRPANVAGQLSVLSSGRPVGVYDESAIAGHIIVRGMGGNDK